MFVLNTAASFSRLPSMAVCLGLSSLACNAAEGEDSETDTLEHPAILQQDLPPECGGKGAKSSIAFDAQLEDVGYSPARDHVFRGTFERTKRSWDTWDKQAKDIWYYESSLWKCVATNEDTIPSNILEVSFGADGDKQSPFDKWLADNDDSLQLEIYSVNPPIHSGVYDYGGLRFSDDAGNLLFAYMEAKIYPNHERLPGQWLSDGDYTDAVILAQVSSNSPQSAWPKEATPEGWLAPMKVRVVDGVCPTWVGKVGSTSQFRSLAVEIESDLGEKKLIMPTDGYTTLKLSTGVYDVRAWAEVESHDCTPPGEQTEVACPQPTMRISWARRPDGEEDKVPSWLVPGDK